MSTPTNVYTDADGAVFVQSAPGSQVYYLGDCWDVGDLPNPKGARDPIWCHDQFRKWKTVGYRTNPPDKPSIPITGLMEKTADWLERFAEKECPFVAHFTQSKCGSKGTFGNWERIFSYVVWGVTDDVISNLKMREPSNDTMRAFTLDAAPGRIDSRELIASRQTTTEAQALNDIWACPTQCVGTCGPEIDVGDHVQAGADAVGAGTANVQLSTDGGTTWAAAAADPFAADENIIAGQCFEIDKDTVRWLVVRDTDVAAPLEIGYSDDSGATWTNVVVGATNGEAATGPQSLFAMDLEHIWLVTDEGEVFFSADGAVTWASQGAITPSGANPLNAVHFINANVGYAVGDADTVIYTEDGGDNWSAATATGGANALLTVQVLQDGAGQWLLVGDDDGELYHSWDGTTTWTLTRDFGAGTSLNCISMSTDLTGLLVHDTAAPVGTIYHTVDGGANWVAVPTPTNQGLNSVIMLSPTVGYAVGETESATAVIIKITG